MPDGVALGAALVVLAAALAASVLGLRRRGVALDWLVAAVGALALLAAGVAGWARSRHAVASLGPTVGFLAALLVLAEGCRREGLFDAIGELIARRARRAPSRLLGLVFAVASATTIVLGLDATVVLLTPVVLLTVHRLRVDPRPPLYACAHLANSASLLLPVSNLTNLLAFRASGLSFVRFAALMAAPTAAAVAVDWVVLSRLRRGAAPSVEAPEPAGAATSLPRWPLIVLALTLAGFAVSSAVSVDPVWVAVAGAAAITAPAIARGDGRLALELARAAQPGFLVFVFALGIIVAAAGAHGLSDAVRDLLPDGASAGDLLLVAAIAAALANVVNNLPATLLLVPVAARLGAGPVLAVLIGVNIGPNLTDAGSLATLLWRRILRAGDVRLPLSEFVRLGALTVPPALLAGALLLWGALQI